MSDQNPAGWHPDPTGRFSRRYFDGKVWTGHVANQPGENLSDPLPAPPHALHDGETTAKPSAPEPVRGSPDRLLGGAPRPKPGLSVYLICAGAAIGAIASFLAFYEIDLGIDPEEEPFAAGFGLAFESSWNLWADAWSIFPLLITMVGLAIVTAALLATQRFGSVRVPERLLGAPLPAHALIAAALGFVTVSAFVLRPFLDFGDEEDPMIVGLGGWLLLVSMAGLLIGSALESRGTDSEVGRSPADDQSTGSVTAGTWVLLAAAVAILAGSFLPVLGAAGGLGELADSTEAEHAWVSGLRPVFGLPAIAALVVVALALLGRARSGDQLGRFGVPMATAKLAASCYAAFASLALLVGNPVFGGFSSLVELKSGFYLMLVGSVGLVAGCLLDRRSAKT